MKMSSRNKVNDILNGLCAIAAISSFAMMGCAVETERPDVDDIERTERSSELQSAVASALRSLQVALSYEALQPSQATFVSHGDYIAANVAFAAVGGVRQSIEGAIGRALKHRGEAHITTITPIEMGVLRKKMTPAEVEKIAQRSGVQQARVQPLCIGFGEKRGDSTFYLVVQSEDLLQVRRAIAAAFMAKGGAGTSFDAEAFSPHVTLGFTKRDLFEGDGVVKTVASCPNPMGLQVSR